MSEQSGNIERLLERYVLGELSEDDRRMLEQYLTGPGEDAARARADLRFEQSLLRSFATEIAEHDVAGSVLDRVFRRPELEQRRHYRADLASTVLHQARAEGRIGPPRRRLLTPKVRRLTGLAASLLLIAFLLWSTTIEPTNERHGPIIDPALVGEVAVMPCSADPRLDAMPEPPRNKVGRPIRIGDEITTDAEEMALLQMRHGEGRVVLLPLSRLRVVRTTPGGPLSLRVLEGGIQYDFSRLSAAMSVETDKGHRGKLQGRGEMMIASASLGAPQPALESSLGQIVLVRVKDRSWANFESPQGPVRISKGQLGIVGPESAMTVAESSLTDIAANLRTIWRVDSFLADADQPVMRLPGEQLNRGDVVTEALRVYKYDLIEMMAVSFVVDVELAELGISPSQSDQYDAMTFVRGDELTQVLPLRAEEAMQTRSRQIAGLLAIDRERLRLAGQEYKNEPVAVVRQRIWPQLARGLELRRGGDQEDTAFELRYRGKSLDISRARAWARLRQLMRVSEMDRLMRNQAERRLLSTWLEKRGEHWHEEASSFAAPFVAMAQMTGVSRVQLQDSIRVAQVIQSVVQAPSGPEIERFMLENVTKRRPLVFDHWFFPTTDPFRGYGLDGGRAAVAHRKAEQLVADLRAGKKPEVIQDVPRFTGSIWSNQTAGGPQPWWNEIYGRDFGLAVSNLSIGQVSEPIQSPEGWHVVRLLHEGEEQTDPRAHRSYAMQLYRYEIARRTFDGIVAQEVSRLAEPASLLR
ncbi:MAG: peptidylprolyl isomerase [Planctomycetes bacterium]|nr:peptidylprolyl isomerase [Planctomycetota bacterium]